MENKIIDLLKNVFEGTEITIDSSQENVELWDSMHQLSIAFELESSFGISIEPDEMVTLKSVRDIISFIENKK